MKMSDRESKVLEFQKKYGSPSPRNIGTEAMGTQERRVDDVLEHAALALEGLETLLGRVAKEVKDDPRVLRMKLMVSELSEVGWALRRRDENELADGLADLEYVTVGTAVTYSLPLGAVFDEVHRSNMTKSTAQEAVANHTGDKGKGPSYEPPRVADVITAARKAES